MKRTISSLSVFTFACGVMIAQTDTSTVELNDMVVTGVRTATDVRHLPLTVSILNRQALTQDFQSNVLSSVNQEIPGTFINSRGIMGYGVSTGSAGTFKVRGIGGMASTLILIDGTPQYAGLMGHPIPDAYQIMLAERVEVLRGPASMLYGSNAMGGVLNIVTRKMDSDGISTDVTVQGGSYGTWQGDLSGRFREGKFSGIVGLDYGRTDGHRKNSKFEQYSGFLKLGYDLSSHWDLSGDFNITHFNASNPGEVSDPYIDNDSKITRSMASAAISNDYGLTSGSVRVFYNWGHHNIDDGYHPGGKPRPYIYKHNDNMGGVSIYQTASLFKGNHITLGLDYQHFGGKAWNDTISNGKDFIQGDKHMDEWAGYADFRQDITSWFTADVGLRIDRHSQAGTELIPQGGISFRLSSQSELKAMISKGFRNPTIREMYMFRPANDQLEPEHMMNYELSFKQRLLEDRLMFGVNLFYLKADNLISTAMLDGKPLNVNTGKTENSGFEVEASYRFNNHLKVRSNYSYLHMSNPQTLAPESKLYVAADYQTGGFSIHSGLQLVDGLYLATGEDKKKESYVLWNLTAAYQFTRHLSLFAKGDNLLAQRYQTLQGFPMPKATLMGGVKLSF